MALYRYDRQKSMNSSTHPAGYNSMAENNLKRIRESMLMSKSELAREANVSPITISRIEQGKPCRMETKRKLLLALGLDLSESQNVFGE
jgi:DNA-binding XRE family transcriptional regulator